MPGCPMDARLRAVSTPPAAPDGRRQDRWPLVLTPLGYLPVHARGLFSFCPFRIGLLCSMVPS